MAVSTKRTEYARTAIGDSIDVATMKVLKESFDAQEDKNLVLSPLGVMMLLSLYNEGAGPEASRQLTQFLGGIDAKQTAAGFKELNAKLAAINPNVLSVADKIVVAKDFVLNEAFAQAARDYGSEIESVDFTKPEETAAKINQWSAEKTKGRISKPVAADTLTPDMAAALLNVIFFKGAWHVPFKARDTKKKTFYLNKNDTIEKEMMHLHKSLYYQESEALGARMIELPYKEAGFRMVVVLPNDIDGLPSVLEKAAGSGLLSDVFELRPAGADVDLDMPKFDIRTKVDFNDVLKKIGVNKIFDEPAPGIVKNDEVKVSKVFQEAFIEVNEEGATAGAFTGLCVVYYSSKPTKPKPLKFKVDHPFLYAVLYEDKILFAGTYSGDGAVNKKKLFHYIFSPKK